MQKLKRKWEAVESLDDRIYFLTIIVAMFVSIIAYILDVVEGLSFEAQAAVAAVFLLMVLLLFLGIRFPSKRKIFRLLLIVALNFILFPLSFIFSGGIHSGMILFFLVGLFLVPVMLRGRLSVLLFVLSVLVMIIVIDIAQIFPEIVAPMSIQQHYEDVRVTLLISGAGLYSITMLILAAYNRERKRNEELMDSFRRLSMRDALSGLYNRRELYRRLEIMYDVNEPQVRRNMLIRPDHFIVMYDIDDFKAINDRYGHSVGDDVLREVAHVLEQMIIPKEGEMSARYGGEEFVCVLCASGMEEAFLRADKARQQIAGLKWEKHRTLSVTISGGIVSCMEEENLAQAMQEVDSLLYKAKASGKNRICRKSAAE